MEENAIFHERYRLISLLGRGNFSEVWLAEDSKTKVEVALKIYAPATGLDDEGLNVLAREFALVAEVNHRNLLKPLHYDTCDRKPYLVLPYCKKGSTMKYVGRMSEQDAWRFIRDVASGLAFLHDHDPAIIHQDIKPDNVMVGNNGDYMITDFGVSTHVRSTLRKSMSAAFKSAGTTAYMAPERFSRDNTPVKANDIYSLGATVFELLTGDAPFGDEGGILQMKGAEVPQLRGDYSSQLKRVVDMCLHTDPWERPIAPQLEKYATQALEGNKIDFPSESNFLTKYKKPLIIAVGVLVVAAIVLVVILSSGDKGKASTAPVTEAPCVTELPTYLSLVARCDSLTSVGANDNCDALLAAKETLREVRRLETLYFADDSVNYNKARSLGERLDIKLRAAAEAWRAAANVQRSLGENERAEEYFQLAERLDDGVNSSAMEISGTNN